MGIKSERPIYTLVSNKLRKSKQPMTCTELMEDNAIREEAIAEFGGEDNDVQLATNKLSDIVGFMWRRGLLTRYPAPRDSRSFARYAYQWTDQRPEESKPVPPPVKLKTGHNITVIEHDDGIEIQFALGTLYFKPK